MIIDDRSFQVILLGLVIIAIALIQYFCGVAFTHKGFLNPTVAFRKKEEQKSSFYFSVKAQIFFGVFMIIVALVFAVFRSLG
ncbi:hypothetical protein [Desulfogranum mediterraneum]|uniref:hypothetical protein n=1 Tax=Desulfogranum mediterraneum TaxID=160661 RepID=UPI00048B1ECB|nr:hypothetical protein [Desulfogranum mediterraneum]